MLSVVPHIHWLISWWFVLIPLPLMGVFILIPLIQYQYFLPIINGTKVSMYYEDTFNPPPIHIFQCERPFGNMMLYGLTPFIIFSQLMSVDFNVLIFYSQYHNYQMQVKAYRPLKWWISSVVQGRWCCVLTAVKSVCAWIFYATFSTPLTWCLCEHDTVFSGLCEHDF